MPTKAHTHDAVLEHIRSTLGIDLESKELYAEFRKLANGLEWTNDIDPAIRYADLPDGGRLVRFNFATNIRDFDLTYDPRLNQLRDHLKVVIGNRPAFIHAIHSDPAGSELPAANTKAGRHVSIHACGILGRLTAPKAVARGTPELEAFDVALRGESVQGMSAVTVAEFSKRLGKLLGAADDEPFSSRLERALDAGFISEVEEDDLFLIDGMQSDGDAENSVNLLRLWAPLAGKHLYETTFPHPSDRLRYICNNLFSMVTTRNGRKVPRGHVPRPWQCLPLTSI